MSEKTVEKGTLSINSENLFPIIKKWLYSDQDIFIRELVSNAVRHGNAWTIKVAGVRDGSSLLFSVTDDGTGFDPEHCNGPLQGHFGLDGIRERLARLDGSISFETPRSGGTRAVIRMPLHPTQS